MNQWNAFFINEYTVIPFIFSDHFSFLVALGKRKNKNMGNCISKIKKDHFFAIEALMKNEILFSNGIIRFGLDMLTGGTYMRLHSIKKIPEKITFAILQTGVWWRDL